jgi:tRNA pseudouridine55 synthase
VIDKPEGPTSHDVVARVRRALRLREVGHTGTLDPIATGVLALVLGRATRLAQFLSGARKGYQATIRLGIGTDSWDRTGQIVRRAEGEASLPGEGEVRRQLDAMVGERDQVPPPFSAKKVAGVRAYALARSGRMVAPLPARVALHDVALLAWAPPLFEVRIACSAGYYVRALANELGESLGCGACLESLRRLNSGPFTLARAMPLAAVEQDPAGTAAAILAPEELLPELPDGVLTEEGARRVSHGNDVAPEDFSRLPAVAGIGAVRLLGPDGCLLAVARPGRQPGTLHPAVVLK